MISLPIEKLKNLLVGEGVVDAEKFDAAYREAQHKKQDVVDVLISQGFLNKDYFYNILSKSLGLERVNFSAVKIDEKVLRLLPEDIARKKGVIVFARREDGGYDVAMEDPTDLETIDFLSLRLGGSVKPFLATHEDLDKGFSLYGEKLTEDFKEIIEQSVRESLRSKREGDLRKAAEDLPVVSIVGNLLSYAVSSRASDIHFEVLEDSVLVRFRVDGVLHEIINMPKQVHPAVVARVKVLSGLRVDEHRRPQDGRFRHKISSDVVDVRVSILPTFYGEKIVMRLLKSTQKPLSLAELGMLEDTVKLVTGAIAKSFGMIVVCGPTGSGKTTTLYSVMDMLNRPEVNVVTVEDPIEYDMRYVNQVQVNEAAGITFASGLRSILRQDPNIIMVGEIRDGDTANISVQAALTGHLVLSSLHTNDAVTAVPRLVDMKVPPFLAAAVFSVVVAQRLARKIHIECIESYVPGDEILSIIESQLKGLGNEVASRMKMPETFYRGRGCDTCGGTGYLGRVGVYEVLNFTEDMRKLVVSGFDLDALKDMALKGGMRTMFEDGLRKVELGLTTVDEVLRVMRE